eukprot:SAG31_NODE_18813_length_622_cov_0.619503_2_plen_106_part_01
MHSLQLWAAATRPIVANSGGRAVDGGLGLESIEIGGLLTAMGVVMLLLMLLGYPALDRAIGARKILILGALIEVVGFIVLPWCSEITDQKTSSGSSSSSFVCSVLG